MRPLISSFDHLEEAIELERRAGVESRAGLFPQARRCMADSQWFLQEAAKLELEGL